MATGAHVELTGLPEVLKANDQLLKDLSGSPLMRGMQDAVMLVMRTARMAAKVDTGRYRASIAGDVWTSAKTVEGAVGSSLAYAPFVVNDTRPHWPPRAALVTWARRHNVPVFLVMRAIARRGTKGDQSLYKGLEQNAAAIERLIGNAVDRAVQDWGP